MTIRFESETIPSPDELLEQAAGVGIEFDSGSLQEQFFVDFCNKLWLHGWDCGVSRLVYHLNKNPIGTESAPNG